MTTLALAAPQAGNGPGQARTNSSPLGNQTALATHVFYLELDRQAERGEQEQTLVANMLDSLASALLGQARQGLQTQSMQANLIGNPCSTMPPTAGAVRSRWLAVAARLVQSVAEATKR